MKPYSGISHFAVLKMKLMPMGLLLLSSIAHAVSFSEGLNRINIADIGERTTTQSESKTSTFGSIIIEGCTECSSLPPVLKSSQIEIINFSKTVAYRCEKTDDYIGRAIDGSKSDLVRHLASMPLQQTMIKSACTKQAMEKIILPGESFQPSCVATDARSEAPCVSQSYHQLMHNSLDLVSRCSKDYFESEADENKGRYDEVLQEMIGKLTLESNFHLNAVSPTKYSGPGQLNYGSIEDVNNHMSAKDSMLTYLQNHKQEDCRALAPVLAKKMRSNSGPCEKISLDLNHPIANLLYTFNYRMIQRDYLQRGFFDSQQIQDRFSGPEKEEMFNLFKQRMNTWAYNPGAGGLRAKARTAIMRLPKGTIQNAADLSELMDKIFSQFTGLKDPQICNGVNRPSVPGMENGCYLYRLKQKAVELKDSVGGLSCINS